MVSLPKKYTRVSEVFNVFENVTFWMFSVLFLLLVSGIRVEIFKKLFEVFKGLKKFFEFVKFFLLFERFCKF